MATPPGAGGEVPQAGYYPDPSIPGYIRYWNGGAWVPGTSRPAPREGELPPSAPASAMPPGPALAPNPSPAPVVSFPAPAGTSPAGTSPAAAPAGASPAPGPAVEETGPVFLDEEPAAAPEPEPASAWQADVSRQTGFGGDRDRKVSWGAPEAEPAAQDPRVAAARAAEPEPKPAGPAGPQARLGGMPVTPASAPDPTGGALPGVRQAKTQGQAPRPEGTMTIRALPTQGAPASPQNTRSPQGVPDAPGPQGPQALDVPQAGGAQTAQPSPAPLPHAPGRPQAQAAQPQAQNPAPVTTGPGGGAPSWPQQVHQLAQPGAAATPAAHQQAPQSPPAHQSPQAPQSQPAQQTPPAQRTTPQTADQEQQPVVPWKPPVEDPFLEAARRQAAARPAGLGKRLVARFIDTLVLGALVGGASFPFVTAALDHIDAKIEAAKQSGVTVQVWLLDGTTSLNFGIALGALLVLGVLYEALPTARWGRTLGKKLCGLQVRDIEAHEPPTFGAALRRWLVYSVLGLLVLGVLNVLWCLFDRPWRQCWHDKAAHTFVAG